MSLENKYIICIGGPTGIGKTTLSILLAQKYNIPIISTDSRQFFKEMNIGTAKPTKQELSSAEHYLIDNLSIHQEYSVGQFEKDALQTCQHLFKSHDCIIAIGGSGLYFQALCEGLDNFPSIPKEIRNQLIDDLERGGLKKLLEELRERDYSYFEKVDKKNPRRIVRALEVIRTSSQPYSSFLNKKKTRTFNCIQLYLNEDRTILYPRINARVDKMIENGLQMEAKFLYPYKDLKSLQTVGYQEFFRYFDGEITRSEAIELIKRNSRRYAKRQITWFKNKKWKSFSPQNKAEIFDYIQKELR